MFISPGDLIKRSVEVYRVHWASLLRYVGLLFALIAVAVILLVLGLVSIIGVQSAGAGDLLGLLDSISGSFIVFLFVWAVAMIILSSWIQVAFTRTVSHAVLGQPKMTIGQELKLSWPLVGRIIGISVVVFLITSLPLLVSLLGWVTLSSFGVFGGGLAVMNVLRLFFGLLGIYGVFHVIYFSNSLGFAGMAGIIDGHPIQDSLKKSNALVKGRWWGIFGRQLAAGLVVLMPYYVFALLAQIPGVGGIFFALVSFVYYVFCLIPMSIIPPIVLYHNAKQFPHHESPKTK